MNNKTIFFLGVLLSSSIAHAQTFAEQKKLASFSNKEANELMIRRLKNDEKQRYSRLSEYLLKNPNISAKIILPNSGIRQIMDVLPNGELIYAQTDNEGAAITARANKLYNGGFLGINIQGQNMIAGVWDGGSARTTHQEFMVGGTSKLTNMDGAANADHATHVTGTICAQGILPSVRGIAFNASAINYDWNSDLAEMNVEAANGLLVSNHSYGFGSLSSLWFFGAYDSRANQIDEICMNNPYYLPIVSAGNSRNLTTAPSSTQISNKSGYDMIFGHGNAKNVMTVAAVNEVPNYVNENSVVMSSFSSYGPSDDGRIKPDISMKGVNVRSTLPTTITSTGFMSGTSMASPGVTGVVLLLQQYYNQLYSTFMRSATVKGLILHTADEAGSYPGPDYEFGWGLINAEKASVVIRDKNSLSSTKSIIEEKSLVNGTTYTKTITVGSGAPLKVSLSWTDPQSPTYNSGIIDPATKYLVNDLDIKITKIDDTYYPWKLQGMSATFDPPTNTGTNNVDNFERIDIDNPSGTYTITVTHKGTLVGGNQNFSLIATANNLTTLSTNEAIAANDNKVDFYPNPAKDFIQVNEKDDNLLINIYDVSGKLVLASKLIDNRINVSSLLKGNYVATFVNKKGENKNFKFIKK